MFHLVMSVVVKHIFDDLRVFLSAFDKLHSLQFVVQDEQYPSLLIIKFLIFYLLYLLNNLGF